MFLALLLVRLIFGLGFAAHGAQKLFGWFGGHGLAGVSGMFDSMGFRPGRVFATAAGLSELAGGVLVALGLGGPVGPMLVIATMVVAIVAVHWSAGFFAQNSGYELALSYALLAVVFAFVGFGAYSLDAVFGWAALWTTPLAALFVGLGIVGGLLNVAARRKVPPAAASV